MVTITLTLDDEIYALLERKAGRLGQPVEALLAALAAAGAISDRGVTAEFAAEVRDMIETYRPVFHRLAQ